MLADPYRLEGEPDVAWQRPPIGELVRAGLATVTGGIDGRRVSRLAGELERGLRPADPAFAQWCLQKLFVLPTQSSGGLSAALMADNFIDVAGHFASDLWQAATLELLKTCTFRPSPAQLVALAGPRHDERVRMLARVRTLAVPAADAARPFVAEPPAVRLRTMRDGFRRIGHDWKAATYERALAGHEGRPVEAWAAGEVSRETQPMPAETTPSLPPPGGPLHGALLATLAAKHRAAGRIEYADRLDREADAQGHYRPMQREEAA